MSFHPTQRVKNLHTGFFVDLNGSSIGFNSNDLTDEFIVTDIDLDVVSKEV